jgi:hypothetical protein
LFGTLIVPSIQQAGYPGNGNLAKANRAVSDDVKNIETLSRLSGARRKTRTPGVIHCSSFGELKTACVDQAV